MSDNRSVFRVKSLKGTEIGLERKFFIMCIGLQGKSRIYEFSQRMVTSVAIKTISGNVGRRRSRRCKWAMPTSINQMRQWMKNHSRARSRTQYIFLTSPALLRHQLRASNFLVGNAWSPRKTQCRCWLITRSRSASRIAFRWVFSRQANKMRLRSMGLWLQGRTTRSLS